MTTVDNRMELDITYQDPWNAQRYVNGPELFAVTHQRDFTGDVTINMEDYHSVLVHESDTQYARHKNGIIEVTLPFEVVAKIAAEAVRAKLLRKYNGADYLQLLGLR